MRFNEFGLTWQAALTVVLTAVGLYLLYIIVVRLLGQRVLGTMSSLDVMVVITMGAVLGRAILGDSTDLLGGSIALLTLLVIQALFHQLRRWRSTEALLRNAPLALVVDGVVHEANLKRAHVDPQDLWARMRMAGVHDPGQVALMVLESTGQISLLHKGGAIDPRLTEGIRGVDASDRARPN